MRPRLLVPALAVAGGAALAGVGAVAAGCSGGSTHDEKPAAPAELAAVHSTAVPGPDAGGPVMSGIKVTANPANVLSAVVTFTTDRPALDHVQVENLSDGGAGNGFTTPTPPTPTTSHSVNVIGMRALSNFTFKVFAADPSTGATSEVSRRFSTPALPAFVPPITVVSNDKSRTSPGFTMLTTWEWSGSTSAGIDPEMSAILILDSDFEVVWYQQGSALGMPWAPTKMPSGDILYLNGLENLTEIDMMNNVVRTTTAAAEGLQSLHHDVLLEDGGTSLLTMSSQAEVISGYPGGDGGSTYAVVGNSVAELELDGGLLGQWSTFSMQPPFSVYDQGDPSAFLTGFWNGVYPSLASKYGGTKDWIHGNAVSVNPSDGTIVASSRTLSWIYKFARTGGGADGGGPRVLWRLGPGGDVKLTNPAGGFQYGQHAAYVTSSGTVMCFDDGLARPVDAGQEPYSRALEYKVNGTTKKATVVWQYQEPSPGFYSTDFGSSYRLDNGDVLVDDGGEVAVRSGSIFSPQNLKSARVFEVTHASPATKVAEFDVNVPLGAWPPDPAYSGFSVYRAVRIPLLY